jgi:hypothetical protein
VGRLWGRDGSRWTSVNRHWSDIKEYQKYKDEPELHEGKIGVTPMTKKQKADKAARDAKKANTPMHSNRQQYSSSASGIT